MVAVTTQEKFIELSAGKTRYLEAGSGEPLIMLHGMGIGSSANGFDVVLEPLAEHRHVYAMDMLGFGLGDRDILEGPTFSLITNHVREFMDSQGIEKASLLGHSAGGWMGAIFAYESPSRIDKLVLLCSAGLNATPSPGIRSDEIPSYEQSRAGAANQFLDKSKATDALLDRVAEAQQAALKQPGALHSLDTLLQQMETVEVRQRYLLHGRLQHIKAPTLVIWGEGDTMDPYPTWTEEYAALGGDMTRSTKPWVIPGAKHVLFKTGHNPQNEEPEQLVEVVLDFLKG